MVGFITYGSQWSRIASDPDFHFIRSVRSAEDVRLHFRHLKKKHKWSGDAGKMRKCVMVAAEKLRRELEEVEEAKKKAAGGSGSRQPVVVVVGDAVRSSRSSITRARIGAAGAAARKAARAEKNNADDVVTISDEEEEEEVHGEGEEADGGGVAGEDEELPVVGFYANPESPNNESEQGQSHLDERHSPDLGDLPGAVANRVTTGPVVERDTPDDDEEDDIPLVRSKPKPILKNRTVTSQTRKSKSPPPPHVSSRAVSSSPQPQPRQTTRPISPSASSSSSSRRFPKPLTEPSPVYSPRPPGTTPSPLKRLARATVGTLQYLTTLGRRAG
ncbi:hypothetical protein HK104_008008, partial [Borealophlyctis nickersoniae]